MIVKIVLGAGFGDEGKGSTVNYLCSTSNNPLVVRFNGGHQVGHTVVKDGERHVFSNYGSGSLNDVPTYWSQFCTVSPIGVMREGLVLKQKGLSPTIYYNGDAMVTTPYDIQRNINLEMQNKHGSVGVGFGQTIQRNEDNFKLYVRDLFYPEIRDEKLRLIKDVYYKYGAVDGNFESYYKEFIDGCDYIVNNFKIVNSLSDFDGKYDTFVFEGGQGIMLDMDYGFFPHVTRSNCTSKNAINIIKNEGFGIKIIDTYYITRAYLTRHGNGYMPNEGSDISYIKDNPNETNVLGFQGKFRKAILDLDMLKYAIDCDKTYNTDSIINGDNNIFGSNNNIFGSSKHLVVTCLDQVPDVFPVTINGSVKNVTFSEIGEFCKINNILTSYSDEGIKI